MRNTYPSVDEAGQTPYVAVNLGLRSKGAEVHLSGSEKEGPILHCKMILFEGLVVLLASKTAQPRIVTL
jgi:hypothetical protein